MNKSLFIFFLILSLNLNADYNYNFWNRSGHPIKHIIVNRVGTCFVGSNKNDSALLLKDPLEPGARDGVNLHELGANCDLIHAPLPYSLASIEVVPVDTNIRSVTTTFTVGFIHSGSFEILPDLSVRFETIGHLIRNRSGKPVNVNFTSNTNKEAKITNLANNTDASFVVKSLQGLQACETANPSNCGTPSNFLSYHDPVAKLALNSFVVNPDLSITAAFDPSIVK